MAKKDTIDAQGRLGPRQNSPRSPQAPRGCVGIRQDNRDEAIKDLRFLALDQWPQSVRDQRAAEDRPCLTLDHLNQYKNQVVNDIRQAKIALRAVGVDSNSDPELAELMTGLMRDVQYNSAHRIFMLRLRTARSLVA